MTAGFWFQCPRFIHLKSWIATKNVGSSVLLFHMKPSNGPAMKNDAWSVKS